VSVPVQPVDEQLRRARAVVATRTGASLFVLAMLGFGLLPLITAISRGPAWTVLAGAAAFALVAVAFVRLITDAVRRPWRNRSWREATLIALLSLLLPVILHSDWQVITFLPVAAMGVSLRPRLALVAVLGVLAVATVERHALGVDGIAMKALRDLAIGAALAGIIVLVAFVGELFTGRAEVALLAVSAERSRFARDLHETLGHNLSAITLKTELAIRLIDIDQAQARAELADVHEIARASLREVHVVAGSYRDESLQRELQGVQSVLVSAGVRCAVTPLPDALPGPVEKALSWAVREAATNLLRHSAATRCDIAVEAGADAVRLAVANDGVGGMPLDRGGKGLASLAERLAPLGGLVNAGVRANGDFLLTVHIPIRHGTGPEAIMLPARSG
jgi:two-component system, NarL family, sensor histidine kinase DesK